MTFQISGLDPQSVPAEGARVRVESSPGYPCRVSLEDAPVGEEVLLVHYAHAEGPWRASGPIYVRPGAARRVCAPGEVPVALTKRVLSVRQWGANGALLDADVIEGPRLAQTLASCFENPAVAWIDVHFAKPGCFACRAVRVAAR